MLQHPDQRIHQGLDPNLPCYHGTYVTKPPQGIVQKTIHPLRERHRVFLGGYTNHESECRHRFQR